MYLFSRLFMLSIVLSLLVFIVCADPAAEPSPSVADISDSATLASEDISSSSGVERAASDPAYDEAPEEVEAEAVVEEDPSADSSPIVPREEAVVEGPSAAVEEAVVEGASTAVEEEAEATERAPAEEELELSSEGSSYTELTDGLAAEEEAESRGEEETVFASSEGLTDEETAATTGREEEAAAADLDGTLDHLSVDVDCSSVKAFPRELFAAQPDVNVVYDTPVEMPDGIFKEMGFNRFLNVFGVPIVASYGVSDVSLKHAAQVFAGFVDNDEDGLPDRPSSIQSVRDYQTVIGYVSGAEESDALWKDLYTQESNREFRQQFACNMHFFEQWSTDATLDFYDAFIARAENEAVRSGEDTCSTLEDVEFDWPLWYFPFTMTYYGYQEDFDQETLDKIEEVMARARSEELFFGNYPDDKEMEMADFFVWSLLTKLGALECHCESDIIEEVWKICTPQGLKQFDEEWFTLLETLEGIPKKLPTGQYTVITREPELAAAAGEVDVEPAVEAEAVVEVVEEEAEAEAAAESTREVVSAAESEAAEGSTEAVVVVVEVMSESTVEGDAEGIEAGRLEASERVVAEDEAAAAAAALEVVE